MPFIQPVSDEDASEAARADFAADRERLGYVPTFSRLLAHHPAAVEGWQALIGAIRCEMDARRYELVTLAAARALRSSYCSLAHGKVLADRFFAADAVRRLALDHHDAGLDEVDVAVMDLADKVVRDATGVTQADVDRLRALGLSDKDVLDVVLAAAARCFFSKTLDALGAEPDAEFRELDPAMRDALVVGRPIATT